jgi:hypothetical protein
MGIFPRPVGRESRLLRGERMTAESRNRKEAGTFVPHVAQWSLGCRARLQILTTSGDVAASYPITPPGERPGYDILDQNGWIAYPGAEWEEEPEGQWSLPVFPDWQPRGNGEQGT